MPTGYTAYIEDGDITTGKEFLKLCTRAFGVAIDQKDDPLSVPTKTKFEPGQYYIDAYNGACDELKKAKSMSFNEAKLRLKTRHHKKVDDYKKCSEKYSDLRNKYLKVRREVEAWTPPTPEHDGLKKFALEQIDMCIPSVESINEFTNKSKEPLDLSDEAIAKFIEDNISQCESSVVYYKKAMNDEYEWAQEKQEWMDKFLKSLENMDGEINGVVYNIECTSGRGRSCRYKGG